MKLFINRHTVFFFKSILATWKRLNLDTHKKQSLPSELDLPMEIEDALARLFCLLCILKQQLDETRSNSMKVSGPKNLGFVALSSPYLTLRQAMLA